MNPKLNSLIATLVLAAAVVALLLSHNVIAKVPIGIALQIAAGALMLWARATFGIRSFHATANPTQGGLVRTGPYRYWRHPIYAAVLLFIWTGVLSQGVVPTLIPLLLAVVVTLGTAVRITAEERLLNATFPDYANYSRETKRLVPFIF